MFIDRNVENVKSIGLGKQSTNVDCNIPLNDLNNSFITASQNTNPTAVQSFLEELHNQPPPVLTYDKFTFQPILQIDVLRAINRIQSNATGTDQISIKMIKKILYAVLPVITAIYNTSLRSGVFPDQWKTALVRPVNKIPTPTEPKDFRPISILPALSKGLERIVHCQISHFLKVNNIFDKFQSGFRTNHSTETALLSVTDDIRQAMDRSQF